MTSAAQNPNWQGPIIPQTGQVPPGSAFGIGDFVIGPEERARIRHDGEPYIGQVQSVTKQDNGRDLVWVKYGEPFNRTTSYDPAELQLAYPPQRQSEIHAAILRSIQKPVKP